MMPGPISGSVEILAELLECGTPLYALSIFRRKPFHLLSGGSISSAGFAAL